MLLNYLLAFIFIIVPFFVALDGGGSKCDGSVVVISSMSGGVRVV